MMVNFWGLGGVMSNGQSHKSGLDDATRVGGVPAARSPAMPAAHSLKGNGRGGRKKLGLFLLAIVLAYWVALPFVPFLAIPHKATVVTAAVVVGEVLFLLAIGLLGEEYWGRIKSSVARLLPVRKRSVNSRRDP
ncbi:transporter suffix domain-containing protein [Stenotrophomonas maltophilia]|uniref:transporter suffix domain-containing protein n=2 Tax=Stenotrophomonas maltophilia TaxID=40324 RepID=UPI003D2F7EE9